LAIDLLKIETLVYLIGAVLGRALRHRLNILTKLCFVPGAEENHIKRITALCEKDARKNLKEFESQRGCEPGTFDDFIFYRGMEGLLSDANIQMSPRDAYEAYLRGDKKMKRVLNQKVDAKGEAEEALAKRFMQLPLLQGVFFGSSFPELTQTMYQKAWEDDRSFWTRLWPHGLVMPKELKEARLEEAETIVLLIVADYASKYYPEVIDGLGLMSVIQKAKSAGQDYQPSKYEILNEILAREGSNLIRKSIKHPELLGQGTVSVHTDPFNPSDSEYLTTAFLSGPSHLAHFDPERLETILKKLLQDDYERYYETARQNIVSGRTRPPSGKSNQAS